MTMEWVWLAPQHRCGPRGRFFVWNVWSWTRQSQGSRRFCKSLPHAQEVISGGTHARWILELWAGFRFDRPVLGTFLWRRLEASFMHRVNSSIGSAHDRVLLPARLTWAPEESFIKSRFFLLTTSLLPDCARSDRRKRVTGRCAIRIPWSKQLFSWCAVWMWNSKPWTERSSKSWGSWLLPTHVLGSRPVELPEQTTGYVEWTRLL